jgi:predicted nuclease of restriction endonuclease-like (RecB) superfamily
MSKKITNISPYALFLEQLKTRVQQAQLKASLAVNSELIQLYWDMGKSIVEKQEKEGWKAQVIEKLSKDLQNTFPSMQGFSRTNIFRMRSFYLVYARVPQAVGFLNTLPIANIPWGHNILLIEKIKNLEERLWYAEQTIKHGLSNLCSF